MLLYYYWNVEIVVVHAFVRHVNNFIFSLSGNEAKRSVKSRHSIISLLNSFRIRHSFVKGTEYLSTSLCVYSTLICVGK